MKTTLSKYEFIDGMKEVRPENFTHEALSSLFDYLEQYEDDCGTELEFDPIAFCCEFTEYESLEDFHCEYDKDNYPDLDTIREHTTVIEIEGSEGFIIARF